MSEEIFIFDSVLSKGNTHYCCAVPDRTETVETRTRIVTFNTIETSQHIIGYFSSLNKHYILLLSYLFTC